MITEPLEPCYPARLRQICLSFAARDVPVSHVHCALCDWQAWIDPIICATTSEPAGMLAAVMAAPAAAMTSSAVAFCAGLWPVCDSVSVCGFACVRCVGHCQTGFAQFFFACGGLGVALGTFHR